MVDPVGAPPWMSITTRTGFPSMRSRGTLSAISSTVLLLRGTAAVGPQSGNHPPRRPAAAPGAEARPPGPKDRQAPLGRHHPGGAGLTAVTPSVATMSRFLRSPMLTSAMVDSAPQRGISRYQLLDVPLQAGRTVEGGQGGNHEEGSNSGDGSVCLCSHVLRSQRQRRPVIHNNRTSRDGSGPRRGQPTDRRLEGSTRPW